MGKLCLLACAVSLLASSSSPPARRRYGSIFSLGDSYADTGSGPVVFGWHSIASPVMRPPYGSTFFGRPTGRNCDGRLPHRLPRRVASRPLHAGGSAESLDLPLVPPFLVRNGTTSFRRGANFAVGGATALDAAFFHRWDPPGGSVFPLNTSLGVQMQWFESLKPSLCATTKQCKELFGRSLFFVGAFGANDYLLSLAAKSIHEVRSFVPDVVRTISMAVQRLIRHGATTLVVPGVIPVGCAPPVLVTFADPDPAGYDPRTGCLKAINDLAAHHNALLQDALRELQAKQRPAGAVTVVYADFFGPAIEMVTSPAKFGFEHDVLTLCCGGPGRFHYNKKVFCGDPGAIRCRDPSARLFWDGVHLTEAAYRYVAAGWLSSIESP
ncbi:GDSL esterase/lipase [Panicum miliaceum]|uniref:GDSL esterase/lipase n=1 Tax=Panicum miliaceum TaxID=4540 RepID=A0A3L6SK91_PANMI|nr:GDSL esterase/lipase [Panicum miliaceum]